MARGAELASLRASSTAEIGCNRGAPYQIESIGSGLVHRDVKLGLLRGRHVGKCAVGGPTFCLCSVRRVSLVGRIRACAVEATQVQSSRLKIGERMAVVARWSRASCLLGWYSKILGSASRISWYRSYPHNR